MLSKSVEKLEAQVKRACATLQIPKDKLIYLKKYLEELKSKSLETYIHCIIAGLLCKRIAKLSHLLDPRVSFVSGLLHDIGKIKVSESVLDRKGEWGPEDEKEMHKHVLYSYKMSSDQFPLESEIIRMHHTFQADGYPLKKSYCFLHDYDPPTQALIEFYSLLLSTADCYEAMHRQNSKSNGAALTSRQIKRGLIKGYPNLKYLIVQLYEAEIFE